MKFQGALSLGLSVLLHAALLGGVWWYVSVTPPTIRLDIPVYEVELVTLKPKPPAPKVTKPKAKPKPKQQAAQVKKATPKPKKTVAKATKPKPQKKAVAAKKSTKKKPKPKPKPPTADQLIAEALAKAQKDAKPAKPVPSDVELALADLKPETPDEVGAGLSETLYAQDVVARVRPNWRFPRAADGLGLSATVRLSLDKGGSITASDLVESSGRPDYDASVLKAIQATQVLAPPPQGLGGTVTINFSLSDLAG